METTMEETQHLAVGPIFGDSHFDCGPPSGSLDLGDALLDIASVPSVGDDVPETASNPLLITAQISPNDTANTRTVCEFVDTESPKVAGDILDQSIDPLSIDHIHSPQGTLVLGTTPDLHDYHVSAEDSTNTCEISNDGSSSQSNPEISNEFPHSQSTPCTSTDANPLIVDDCSTLTGLPIEETQTAVNSSLASPPSTEAPTNSDIDTPEIHGSGTSDSGDDSSFANMTTNSSSSFSECSEQTSVASSPMASPVRAKGERIAPSDVSNTDILVKVPDMMSSIMSSKPVVNQHYFSAKPKIDSWTKR